MTQSLADALGSAIFIVGDDPAVRDSMQQLLESIGFTVETYGSGESFLEQASPLEGACVLLDLKLPGLNGLEVLEALAERPYDTSVILITPGMAMRQPGLGPSGREPWRCCNNRFATSCCFGPSSAS